MIISTKVSSNQAEVMRRIRRRFERIEKQGKATTEDIAKLTRDNIVRFMPKDTGASRESIGYIITSTGKGYVSAKIGLISKPHPKKEWGDKGWFNLPWYMFDSPRAETHFRTGNISAMRTVPSYMANEFRRRIEVDVSKILKK